jgi:hypothetical protein
MQTGGFRVKNPLIVAAAAALALTASLSQATVINSAYTPRGGDSWRVDFTVLNDGNPASFAGFTIDFPNATNLALLASPSTWDSAAFQRDPSLPDDAFLDSFVRNASNALAPGQSLGGFGVSFNYTAGAVPGALPFMVYNETFSPLFSGLTTVTAIPEPPMAFLTALGLAIVGLRTVRTHAKTNRSATKEVTA